MERESSAYRGKHAARQGSSGSHAPVAQSRSNAALYVAKSRRHRKGPTPKRIALTVLDLAGFVGTDLRTSDIVSLAMQFAGSKGKITFYSATGPSKGDITAESGGLWLCYENPEGWKTLMEVVDAGEDPSGLDVESTAIIPSNEENQEEGSE